MVASIEQVQKGVANFVENEIAKQATGLRKFAVYFMLPTIHKQVAEYVVKFKDLMPSLFNENGDIDLDILYNNAKSAIQKSGQFEFAGLIFKETDIDTLYRYIRS